MKRILISPYSQKLTSGKKNPKNYPWWQEVIDGIKEKHEVEFVQIGSKDEPKLNNVNIYRFDSSFKAIEHYIEICDIWLAVDNFLQHLVHYHNTHRHTPLKINGKEVDIAKGIVIWGHSDPNIFGYPENTNILLDRKNLRQYQFQTWNEIAFKETIFPNPQIIISRVEQFLGDE